ncbi:MAG: hypothetical protein KAT77_03610 [Nanoarchaeota archaeon]|nr:hypothetical protein [Nanoarchaeota archaeon]
MDSEVLYFRRICSGLRKRQPFRGAYDIVRRDAIGLKLKNDRYRLTVAVRYRGTRPKSVKSKYRANPKLLTPRKSLSTMIGMKLPSLSPKHLIKQKKETKYVLPPDYAAPKVSKVGKDYFSSELEGRVGYKPNVGYARPKEKLVVAAKKEEKGVKPASVDEAVDKAEEKQISEKGFQEMVELSLLVFALSKEKVEIQ